MATMTSATALVVTLTVIAAATMCVSPVAAQCSQYTSCADCACSTQDYMLDSGDNCNQGCQWCPSSSTCEAQLPQNISCPNPVIVHIKSSDDDDGITTATLEGCHLALMSGAVTSIVFIFLIAAAFALLSFCCWHKARNRPRKPDIEWLFTLATAHLPSGEAVVWKGQSATPPLRMQLWGWITCQTLVSLPLLVPAIVWLAVGIPVNISQQGFGFFFAIWFTGGIGIIGQGVGWLADPFKLSPAVRAYVLTSKRALIAVGNQRTKTQVSVKMHNTMGPIALVGVTGNNVSFMVGGVPITFTNLEETGSLCAVLQEQQARNGMAMATAGSMPQQGMPPGAHVAGAGAGVVAVGTVTTTGAVGPTAPLLKKEEPSEDPS